MKNSFFKISAVLLLASVIVSVGVSGIALADKNIRKTAFSSREPAISVNTESGDIFSAELFGREFAFDFNALLKTAEKYRAFIPAGIRVKAEMCLGLYNRIMSCR